MLTYEQQKRILDLIIVVILLIIFLPFWIIVPTLLVISDGFPILFSHKRMGKGGKEFYMKKFRSMIKNAHEILHEQNSELLEKFKNSDWKFPANEDPRITSLGKVLRTLTIDEFPQLFNVLKGEMSMVGPRAYMKKELNEQTKKYPKTKKYVKHILSIKPGITGPWQTTGRNEIPFPQRAKIDAEYAQQKNIWNDIKIILKTPKAMISKW
ncbi:MAG: sugar transferase [Candidatus Pacebacteria bacterium]|jgi:exopolysaccharide production protein ExoY|nr:sugar transferase [Candidatus Paceibacterota bacterium]MBT4652075.1 sugar transferase [Candidatus Paceibacterota bacterium]MBT6756097.1 sugar transferase [Candidatus Paceibacterota bacterium]MBT6921690.1 sugar transferase [Candidatus Paceibacterota bacterium]